MGWKGTVRQIQAANNRARREQERANRAVARDLDKAQRDGQKVIDKAKVLDGRLARDPIKTLSVSYQPGVGFSSTPFEIDIGVFTGLVRLIHSTDDGSQPYAFEPASFDTVDSRVCPLDMAVTEWGSVVAFEVANDDQDYQMRTPWVKKSDPQSSKVFMLDCEHSEYYYPIASSLVGEVVPGHPKIGLIAFEPFRQPTSDVRIRLSDVQLQKGKGGRFSFEFRCGGSSLPDDISEVLAGRRFVDQISDKVNSELNALIRQTQKSQSGCLLLLCLVGAAGVYGTKLLSDMIDTVI